MKKIALSILLLITPLCWIFPQHRLESHLNMFRQGDEIIKQQVEYKDPGRSGENVLWDFSRQVLVNEAYRVNYFETPRGASGEEAPVFISGREHRTSYNYSLENDSLLAWGFRNASTLVENSQPELLLRFPVTFGDSTRHYFYGHGKSGNRLELDIMGRTTTKADAYGMMILPNGDTLKHVLRTRTLKIISETVKPITREYGEKHRNPPYILPDSIDLRIREDSVLFILETFRWYEKGYRYPIFETVRSWERHKAKPEYEFLSTSFFYPPQEHYYLEEDEENLALVLEGEEENRDPWEGLTYNVFPNPVTTVATVELYLPRPVQAMRVQLRSILGDILIDEQKGSFQPGVCSFSLEAYTLPRGNYILNIWLDDKLIEQVLLKR